ncbi:MAG: carboxypeptidase-like regulatory domain-containing protein, partial [Bacteroidia bacterium]|nr:carboxypeptidase-like regulatory domain-containing protein [Bacteroidia bacterium]
MNRTIAIVLLFIMPLVFVAQTFTIKGKITNKNEPLPFVTIVNKGTTIGAISNDLGNYELKLSAGTHTLVFQYVGFKKTEHIINLTQNTEFNMDLKSEGVSLNEIVVKAGEDPSYPIIRKAIKKKKYYNTLVKEYSCQSYIKGLQRLINMPEKFKKLYKLASGENFDTTKLGIIYLSESESNYYYKHPKLQKEIMFSSKVSGNNQAFSFNQLSQMQINFNQNLVDIGGISDRPIISPLNNNAFLYYKFYLLDSLFEDGKKINKIAVKPKRITDPCFTGVIYIQDKTWRLTSADLKLTKDQKINYVDTINIKQLHASILGDSIWMPVNHNLSFSFKFMGIIVNGYFNAFIKNYQLNPKFNNTFFNSEVLIIQDSANKKDSTYWLKNRPTPLTKEEIKDYTKKDSIEKVENTDNYKDSIDKKHNKYKINNLFTGYTYNKTKNNFSMSLPGIVTSGVQYNTVEGLNLSYNLSLVKTYDNLNKHILHGRIRYGFSNYLWGGELAYNYHFNPKKFSRFGIKIKSIAEQYNQQNPIAPLINTGYSLFMN